MAAQQTPQLDPSVLLQMMQQMQQMQQTPAQVIQQPALPSLDQMRALVREEAQAVIDGQERGIFDNPYVKWGSIAVAAVAIGGTLYYFNERLNALEALPQK